MKCEVLFISYKFVKGFLAITFVLLVFSNWNFHDVCQRFLYNQEQNFSLIRQKIREISPSIDMTLQKLAIFILGGLWGNSLSFIAKKPLTNLYEMNSSLPGWGTVSAGPVARWSALFCCGQGSDASGDDSSSSPWSCWSCYLEAWSRQITEHAL